MEQLSTSDVVRWCVDRSGLSLRAAGVALGHSSAWAGMAAGRAAPRLDTVVSIADLAGYDLALVERSSGRVAATIQLPGEGTTDTR